MGKVKENLQNVLEAYEHCIKTRLEGLPLKAIPEVESYMNRHWIEYLMFLDMMEPTKYPEEICDNESCKRDFLMYKINQDIANPNIGRLLNGIYDYIEERYEAGNNTTVARGWG